MKKIIFIIAVLALGGCSTPPEKHDTSDLINAEMRKAAESKASSEQAAVSAALIPPLTIEVPKAKPPIEERFNLSFSNVPAQQFFMAIVSGTRYSMLVHPDVTGYISASLKNVTVPEALEAIREQYGYDYKIEGTRIFVKPLTLQTRIFKVNYLTGARKGTSDLRVTSGSVSDSAPSSNAAGQPATTTPGATSQAITSSKISTTSSNDFWAELKSSLEAIVGSKEGRSVVVSPQSGIVVVRGMWDELRNVSAYLKATQLSVDREVILEAKIIEVTLNDSFQSGINWAAFRTGGNSRFSGGILSPGSTLGTSGNLSSAITTLNPALNGGSVTSTPGQNLASSVPGTSIAGVPGLGTLFGLAFQTSNFAALISFLESQGKVHVLSSPRIATVNNQKAVLKVGTDDFFVTNISTTTTSSGTGNTVSPTVTLQPFFSGVALDVTPQIDEAGNIILHIHPSVSQVNTKQTLVDLGGGSNGSLGVLNLPLASSTVSETDSIVRGQDGHIIAIGGLMSQSTTSDRAQVPGAGDVPGLGALFRNTSQMTQKKELVILLKPTVIQGDDNWTQDILESQRRIESMGSRDVSEKN
jgi:MSHA biogenesis protein MshL